MTTDPHVTFHAFSDRLGTVFMHLGDVRRHFEDETPERTQNLLSKIAISEFGVPQDQALAFAARHLKQRRASRRAASPTTWPPSTSPWSMNRNAISTSTTT